MESSEARVERVVSESAPALRASIAHTECPGRSRCRRKLGSAGEPTPRGVLAAIRHLLRSTRRARLLARESEWKRKNDRKNISPKVREQYARNLAPTSFFDCLWRLRIRSNYKTVEPYLVRFVSDEYARRFHDALVVCTGTTSLLLELYTARAIGGPAFAEIASGFQTSDQHGLTSSTLGVRLAAIRNVAPFLLRVS